MSELVELRDLHKAIEKLTAIESRVMWLRLVMMEISKKELQRENGWEAWKLARVDISNQYRAACREQEELLKSIVSFSETVREQWYINNVGD
jgi:hypothetical protein